MVKNKKAKKSVARCQCPICDSEMMRVCSEMFYCQPCQKKFVSCRCGQIVSQEQIFCPSCGQKLR